MSGGPPQGWRPGAACPMMSKAGRICAGPMDDDLNIPIS